MRHAGSIYGELGYAPPFQSPGFEFGHERRFPLYVGVVVAWVGSRQRPLVIDLIGRHVGVRSEEVAYRQVSDFVPASGLRYVHVKSSGPFLGVPEEV